MPGVCSTSKEKPKGISRLTNEPIDILIYDYFGQSMKLRKKSNFRIATSAGTEKAMARTIPALSCQTRDLQSDTIDQSDWAQIGHRL